MCAHRFGQNVSIWERGSRLLDLFPGGLVLFIPSHPVQIAPQPRVKRPGLLDIQAPLEPIGEDDEDAGRKPGHFDYLGGLGCAEERGEYRTPHVATRFTGRRWPAVLRLILPHTTHLNSFMGGFDISW